QDQRQGAVRIAIANIRAPHIPADAGFALAADGGIDVEGASLDLALTQQARDLLHAEASFVLRSASGGDWPSIDEAAPMRAHVHGETPLTPLWALVAAERHVFEGTASLDMRLRGTWREPLIAGHAALTRARYENFDLGTKLAEIEARLSFADRQLRLDSLSASDGNGGRLEARGTVRFDDALPGIASDVSIGLTNLRLLRRDDLRATVSGDLQLAGTEQGLELAGQLTIERAEIVLADKGSASIPNVPVREINVPLDLQQPKEHAADLPVRLDLVAKAPRRLFFFGMGLNSEWGADLALRGTLDDPRLFGTLSLVRGDFDFATSQFTLTRGLLTFDGQADIDPRLDVAGTT
ncbi:MAG: hypothetical protein D6782_08225, partial [Alphaproteobacteria bacterium]